MIGHDLTFIGVFMVIGFFTFGFRAIFLYYKPQIFKIEFVKNGFDSVPASLLVALVIPFTFFDSGVFLPFRITVGAIILTIPVIYYSKKPGLSLPVAIIFYLILSIIL